MGSHVTDLYLSVATSSFCYTVACTLRDEHNKIKGVLGADINFQTFHELEKIENKSVSQVHGGAA
jgi:hypothetical protein